MKTLLTLAGAAALLAGCATPYSYSQLYGSRYYKAPLDTYPVLILSVDGKDYLNSPVLVDPGRREVKVQAPPGGAGLRETRVFSLDVQPCTRYYLVAVKDNRLASDFQVKVDHAEPIGGCTTRHAQG